MHYLDYRRHGVLSPIVTGKPERQVCKASHSGNKQTWGDYSTNVIDYD